MKEADIQAVLREELKGYGDEDVLDYLTSLLMDESNADDRPEALTGFLMEYAGSEDKCKTLVDNILTRLFGSPAAAPAAADKAASAASEEPVLLKAPVVIAKTIKEQDAKAAQDATLLFGSTQSNFNTMLQSWSEDNKTETEEEMLHRMKNAKKDAKREKKNLAKERVAAPVRTAILESLTRRPVVIHDMMGEDGERGGSPQVDIHLREVSIDLAGLPILDDASVTLAYGRKYGLIGRNGVGKTTFLKYLSAKAFDAIPWYLQILHIEQEIAACDKTALQLVLETDEERDSLIKERVALEAYFTQEEEREKAGLKEKSTVTEINGVRIPDDPHKRLATVYERLEEIDADGAEVRAIEILAGLSFTPEMMNQAITAFSGGWRMRISLARALFIDPDVLLLDEPTNHLDLHAVLWLENYLRHFANTVIIVSHAREFLNEVCTDVLLMKDQKIKRFKGNYDAYEQQKLESAVRDASAKERSDKKRAELQAFITKNIGGGSKMASMAKSRQKMLDKMVEVEDVAPPDPTISFKFPNPGPVAGGWGIRLVDVGFGYPGCDMLFQHVEFSINQNSRIALVGPNGIGKTTLLKIVYEELKPTEGMVTRNQRLRVGRFSQHHIDMLNMKRSALEQFMSDYPNDPPQKIRKHLGAMGISGDLQLKPIYTLSGGQKSRVALATITYTEPHLLLMDEPTNHLDLDTVQALIRALSDFQGGVMIVSHDEHLITAVCDELWIIKNKRVELSQGDFQDYKKEIMSKFKEPTLRRY